MFGIGSSQMTWCCYRLRNRTDNRSIRIGSLARTVRNRHSCVELTCRNIECGHIRVGLTLLRYLASCIQRLCLSLGNGLPYVIHRDSLLGHLRPYRLWLSLTQGHLLSLSLRHRLNRTLRHLLPCHGLGLTLHRLSCSCERLCLSLGHCLCRALVLGPGYIGRSGHALGHGLVICHACRLLPLHGLTLKGSLMLYSLNDCRIS